MFAHLTHGLMSPGGGCPIRASAFHYRASNATLVLQFLDGGALLTRAASALASRLFFFSNQADPVEAGIANRIDH